MSEIAIPKSKRKNLALAASGNKKQFRLDRKDLKLLATEANQVFQPFRKHFDATPKVAPDLTLSQVARICGTTRTVIKNRFLASSSSDQTFSMLEASRIVSETGIFPKRPAGGFAKTITLSSARAGAGKTTISVSLAQGLAMRGMKVLLVDLDPQAQATTLMSHSSLGEPEVRETVGYALSFPSPNFATLPRKTYWPNLDLIPCTPDLAFANVFLAQRENTALTRKQPYDKFGPVAEGLTSLKQIYDVIIIDTAPALDLLAQVATFAADIVLCPVVPTAQGLTSQINFFEAYEDFCFFIFDNDPDKMTGVEIKTAAALTAKRFDLIEVVETKFDFENRQHGIVSALLADAFSSISCPIRIPASPAALDGLDTAYDAQIDSDDPFVVALDAFVDHVAAELQVVWSREYV